jgi:carboxymethylenebutenolidase
MRLQAQTTLVVVGVALLTTACAVSGQDASKERTAAASAQATPSSALPPAEGQARERLEKSPRHAEYVDIKLGDQSIRTWVVYPERKDKTPVVLVIQENRGLTDWIRSVADQLAADGFIAVAPDLLSGKGPGGGNTDSITTPEEMAKVVKSVTPEEVKARLDAVRAHAIKLPASNGKSATVGFCWGGAHSFAYAAHQPQLNAAVVYYGTSPDAAALASIKAPVLGLYGGADARVNATVPPAKAEMEKLGKTYEVHTFDGAGHAFLRQQDAQEGANMKASQGAWPLTLAFIRKHAS